MNGAGRYVEPAVSGTIILRFWGDARIRIQTDGVGLHTLMISAMSGKDSERTNAGIPDKGWDYKSIFRK